MTTSGTRGVDLEILRHKLQAVTVEMAATLSSGALAPTINEERDFAVAIVDPIGQVVAVDNPMRLGALELSARSITRYFKFDMQDGDVAMLSDPHRGTRSVHDWTVLMPLIIDSTTVLHLVAVGHVRDAGGMLAGSYYPPAADVWGEGVPISPVKVRKFGRPVRDIVRTVLLNSRLEDEVARDLETLIACLHVGRRRVSELAQGYGLDTLRAAAAYSLDYTERRVRAVIADWPDGSARGETLLTHNGAGPTEAWVRAVCTIDGDGLTIDLSSSDPQQPGFVNSAAGNATGLALVPLLCALSQDISVNSGLTRAVNVVLAPGTLVSADPPAAVGWSPYHCGAEIVEAVGDAFAGVRSRGSVNAGSSRPLVLVAPLEGVMHRVDPGQFAAGRSCAVDGTDGWGSAASLARAALPSVEAWNSTNDLHIRSLEMVQDSAGAGEWRGAPAVEVVLDIPQGRAVTMFAPRTATGDKRGRRGSVRFVGGLEDSSPEVVIDEPMKHRSIRLVSAGGPGYGDPRRRDPRAVRDDVLNGLVSAQVAKHIYGFQPAEPLPTGSSAGTPSSRRN